MNCPRCRTNLLATQKEGVEIDYCPSCRGVWLDRGELEKIIERSVNYSGNYRHDDDDSMFGFGDNKYKHSHDSNHKHHGKRKSFLSDLFDF